MLTQVHYQLEMLQNADDNPYAPDSEPTLEWQVRKAYKTRGRQDK
jgi:hypothetical protein